MTEGATPPQGMGNVPLQYAVLLFWLINDRKNVKKVNLRFGVWRQFGRRVVSANFFKTGRRVLHRGALCGAVT